MPDSTATLPVAPDAVALSLLNRAKLMLAHALTHAQGTSSLDHMIAIHGLDNSVEFLLRLVSQHLDIEAKTGKAVDQAQLSGLAGEINGFLKHQYQSTLPYLTDIKRLRQVRNLVQHGSVDPGADLSRWCRIVERFFDKVLLLVFGLTRDALRISSLIQHEDVRESLSQAEEQLDKEEYLLSIVASRNAFENAMFHRRRHSHLLSSASPALLTTHQDDQPAHWLYRTVVHELELVKAGVDMSTHARFSEYLQHIPREHWVDPGRMYAVMQRPWNREDALFCYNFASDVALRWQYAEVSPLYQLIAMPDCQFEMTIAGITIDGSVEHGVIYRFAGEDQMEILIISGSPDPRLRELERDNEYRYVLRRYEHGVQEFEAKYTIYLKGIRLRLATNDPERWELMLWYKRTAAGE